ncbi:membrane protein implicated in regulation of membrane protease activity [Desulfobotulus alkaliphilus]|uniref:Membrane protein implicated in regulation of membrane protease activity n=1 Tax=Desulfobotulus alkaliphilus TaxID=622671 RepID=A0A562S2Y1_9BACT|nr:NfeD family protein [Desulfobotulus alkaliphilus]TWI75518.1 membrane protein implicated in regulation of membrane protease activity [Desulfobotulus alkaliphilus]
MVLFEPWHLWVVLGIILVAGEMFTPVFFLACFGVGAFAAALFSLLGTGFVFQVFVFSLISLFCCFAVRPLLLRFSAGKSGKIQTGIHALTGQTAEVLEAFGGPGSHGKVKIGGEVWRARGGEGQLFQVGDLVSIESVSGVTLQVRPFNKQDKEIKKWNHC